MRTEIVLSILIIFDVHFICELFVFIVKWDRIFELLNQILINGFPALQDRPAILEALDLLKYETRCINLILNGAIDRYDTFFGVLFSLSVRKYLNLGAT